MAKAAVSSNGKYYAAISEDGRLKIWDTETSVLKQEYTPDLHLSAPPTCLQWILVSSAAEVNPGSKRKSSSSEHTVQCVVLGTKSGKLLIYNVSTAKVDSVLETKFHNGIPVNALVWSQKYGLFSVNKQNVLYEWDLQRGRFKHKYDLRQKGGKQDNFTTSMTVIPQNIDPSSKYIVTSSYQMHLWRLAGTTATLLQEFGHGLAVDVTAMPFAQYSYLLHSARDERLLSVWDVTISQEMVSMTNEKKPIDKVESLAAPLYNFVLEDAPKQVNVNIEEGKSPKLNLCAVTRSGVLHYYGLSVNGGSSKPMKPTVTLHITTSEATPMPIHICQYYKSGDESGGQVLVGYEKMSNKVVFEYIKLDTSSRTQVLIRTIEITNQSKKKKKKDANNQQSGAQNSVAYVDSLEHVPRKRVAPGASLEVPMEERLSNLALDPRERTRTAINQNLTKLLVQGLHSRDKSIILLVLQKDDPLIAQRTVLNLPADYIPPFLEQLCEMATRKTSQCASVCTWLSALVKCHSSFLLATLNATSSHNTLAKLLAILTQRRSHLCQLLNLKGRIELTLSQRTDVKTDEQPPILEYEDIADDNDDDDEMELENPSAGEELDENYFEESDAESEQNGDANDTESDEDMS